MHACVHSLFLGLLKRERVCKCVCALESGFGGINICLSCIARARPSPSHPKLSRSHPSTRDRSNPPALLRQRGTEFNQQRQVLELPSEHYPRFHLGPIVFENVSDPGSVCVNQSVVSYRPGLPLPLGRLNWFLCGRRVNPSQRAQRAGHWAHPPAGCGAPASSPECCSAPLIAVAPPPHPQSSACKIWTRTH